MRQLEDILDAIRTKGQHGIVYGERGVGKTSLVSIVEMLGIVPVFRVNCHGADTFDALWRRAFSTVAMEVQRPRMGFSFAQEQTRELLSLAETIGVDLITPDVVVRHLRRTGAPLTFIFDEFDQLESSGVTESFAETIKSLSDFAVPATVIIVGIGDSVSSLVRSHQSIERAVVQIRMPRMNLAELGEVVDKAMKVLGMTCAPNAKHRLVKLCHGLPHYAHLLGLYSTRDTLAGRRMLVELDNVERGIDVAVSRAQQSLIDLYHRATASPKKDSLFKQVLLGCALAKTDELGTFAPADVRRPLCTMLKRDYKVAHYSHHLNKWAEGEQPIFEKIGSARKFRFRFRNPLLQPFVIMQGVAKRIESSRRTISTRCLREASVDEGFIAMTPK